MFLQYFGRSVATRMREAAESGDIPASGVGLMLVGF